LSNVKARLSSAFVGVSKPFLFSESWKKGESDSHPSIRTEKGEEK
jgi:hypothetical protein